MLAPLIALIALQSAAPAEPKINCPPDVYCNVPEFSVGNGMKTNSPPPVMVTIQTPASPSLNICDPRQCITNGQAGGMITNVLPSEPLTVLPSSMPPLPLAVAATPPLAPGRHELVVHWPESAQSDDYRRTFKSGAACLKARSSVLDEHRRRTSAIAVNMANRGTILAAMLEAPYAVCVPID